MTVNNSGKTYTALKAFLEDTFTCAFSEVEGFGFGDMAEHNIFNVSQDSRKIEANDLFIAIQGEKNHGLDFLTNVLKNSPAAIISDRQLSKQETECLSRQAKPPLVCVVKDIRLNLGVFADWFYNQPSQMIKVIGITGTNGKTSTAFFTAQLLQMQGKKVALMGTLGNGALDNLQPTMNTTPDAIQVHRLLAEFAQQGFEWLIMEVSSHALCLGRVQAVVFNSVALTQVTRDHIDFHGSELAYQEAKKRLFSDYVSQHKILNLADSTGLAIYRALEKNNNIGVKHELIGYDAQVSSNKKTSQQNCVQLLEAELNSDGISCRYAVGEKEYAFSTHLIGSFNIENLLCAISILYANGFSTREISKDVFKLNSVAGRMELIHQKPTVIVDFAHTPDALQQVMSAIQAHQSNSTGKLVVVFGCGGDRDQGKRPLMGAVAEQLADEVVITSDNPRSENPKQIIEQIKQGLKQPESTFVDVDRQSAIEKVLAAASEDDIILIAGKGHEDYQEIQGVKQPYSDIEVVKHWYEKS